MKTSKHTPGPWGISASTGQFLISQRDTGKIIANTRPRSNEQDFNNARLIAAAPELLEALEACVAYFDGNCVDVECDSIKAATIAAEKARSAIAKTKGENR
jgi:hypothetical protein